MPEGRALADSTTGCCCLWPWMADIQSSLRRLQESIRGLSDASALVGAAAVSVHSEADEASDPGRSIFEHVTSPGNDRGGSPSIASTPTFNKAARHQHRSHRHDEREGSSSRESIREGGGVRGGPPKQQQQEQQQSFLSSIGGDLRESAEVRSDFGFSKVLAGWQTRRNSKCLESERLPCVASLRCLYLRGSLLGAGAACGALPCRGNYCCPFRVHLIRR